MASKRNPPTPRFNQKPTMSLKASWIFGLSSGLNSSEVLATLFTLEMKGIIRQLPGKQFTKVLL